MSQNKSTKKAQEGTMNATTSSTSTLPENVVTKDGETVSAANAVALNYQKVGFVKAVLLAQLNLSEDANIQTEIIRTDAAMKAATDPELASKLKKSLAKLRLVETAMKLNAILRDKGPVSYCFGSKETAKALQLASVFDRPDFSKPPKGMDKDAKVPDLFVPLTIAHKGWEQKMEKDAEKRAERAKSEAEKAVKAAKIAEAAAAERDRQSEETMSLADAILADANNTAPEVVERVDSQAASERAEEEARKLASEQRMRDARNFFRDLYSGQLTAALYWNKYVKRGYISDEETSVLSLKALAQFAKAPSETEIESRVTGSVFRGTLGDTQKRDDKRPRWMVMTVPAVTLVTRDGKVAKDHETHEVLTSNGFVIIEYREAETAKRVALEMAKSGEFKLEDKEGKPLSLVNERGELAWDVFCSVFHLKALAKGAEWAAEIISKRAERRNQSSDETPGRLVGVGEPDDFLAPSEPEHAQPAPKADTERDHSASDPKAAKSKAKGKSKGSVTAEGDVATGNANPLTKGVPGDHRVEKPRTAYADTADEDSVPGTTLADRLLDAAKRTRTGA